MTVRKCIKANLNKPIVFWICTATIYVLALIGILGLFDIAIVTKLGLKQNVYCGDNSTYDSYVLNMNYNVSKHYVPVHFLIFKNDRIVDNDWTHDYIIVQIPSLVIHAYKYHHILKLYQDCNTNNSNVYYTEPIYHTMYIGLFLIIVSNIIVVCVGSVCLLFACIEFHENVLDRIENACTNDFKSECTNMSREGLEPDCENQFPCRDDFHDTNDDSDIIQLVPISNK